MCNTLGIQLDGRPPKFHPHEKKMSAGDIFAFIKDRVTFEEEFSAEQEAQRGPTMGVGQVYEDKDGQVWQVVGKGKGRRGSTPPTPRPETPPGQGTKGKGKGGKD